MSYLKFIAFLYCLALSYLNAQEPVAWEGSKDKFSVRIVLSASELPIDSLLTAKFTLKYPAAYHPDIKTLRKNFLKYAGMGVPPFALVKEEIKKITEIEPGIMGSEILFTFSPQAVGQQALMFQTLRFLSKGDRQDVVEFPLGLFEVDVKGAAADFPWKALIAPPLNLTKDLPVEMSEQNKYKYILNPELEKSELARSITILHSKALPWISFLTLLAIAFAYFVVKMSPPPPRKTEQENLVELEWKNALAELQSIPLSVTDKTQYRLNFMKLDHALRHYFEGKYRIAAPTSTVQEFLNIVSHSPTIDAGMRAKLLKYLREAEMVKYARHDLTDQEYREAIALAHSLMTEQS